MVVLIQFSRKNFSIYSIGKPLQDLLGEDPRAPLSFLVGFHCLLIFPVLILRKVFTSECLLGWWLWNCWQFLTYRSLVSHNVLLLQLGGIVKPNDGYCHLSNDGTYTHSTLQDYPSISQVQYYLFSINLLFVERQAWITIGGGGGG